MARSVMDEGTRKARPVPVAFALFWTLFIGFVCLVVFVGAARQVQSARRPTVGGTITVSEPAGQRDRTWNLEYVYQVDGQSYTGTEYAFAPMPIQGREEVRRHVAAYPVGTPVVVYYDPGSPADAVLRPGLRGSTLWVALCLTPFVVVGLGLWFGLPPSWNSRPAGDRAGPRPPAVTLSGWPRTFLTYLGVGTFALAWVIFGIGFGMGAAYRLFDGFLLDPPVAVPASLWAAVVVGGALGTWWKARRSSRAG